MGVTGSVLVTGVGDYAVLARGLRLLVADLHSVRLIGQLSPEQEAELAAAERMLSVRGTPVPLAAPDGSTVLVPKEWTLEPPQLGEIALLSLGELAREAMAYSEEVTVVTRGAPPDRLVLLRQLALNTAAHAFAEACKAEGISVRAARPGEIANAMVVEKQRKGT